VFVDISKACGEAADVVPMTAMLTLFFALVVFRWWKVYDFLPWPESIALYLTTNLFGHDERARLMRQTIVRYVNFSLVQTMALLIPSVQKRFNSWKDYVSYVHDCVINYFHDKIMPMMLQDERARLMRQTIVRYVNFSLVQTMALLIPSVQKRFNSWKDYVSYGLITEDEKILLEEIEKVKGIQHLYHVPLVWASTIVNRARREGHIPSDKSMLKILDQISDFRRRCGSSLQVALVNVPLIFLQVVSHPQMNMKRNCDKRSVHQKFPLLLVKHRKKVGIYRNTVGVYLYFALTLFASQVVFKGDDEHFVAFFPFTAVVELFLYLGWLRACEALVCPPGSPGDEDLDLNWLIDRNIRVSNSMVTDMHGEYPEIVVEWDRLIPHETSSTLLDKKGHFRTTFHRLLSKTSPAVGNFSRGFFIFGGSRSVLEGQKEVDNCQNGPQTHSDAQESDPGLNSITVFGDTHSKEHAVKSRKQRLSLAIPKLSIIPSADEEFFSAAVPSAADDSIMQLSASERSSETEEVEWRRPGTLPMMRKSRPWNLRRESHLPDEAVSTPKTSPVQMDFLKVPSPHRVPIFRFGSSSESIDDPF
ncbi:unnamed protein product, partial [Notodromas monacha]